MNKKKIIIASILSVLVIATVGWVYVDNGQPSMPQNDDYINYGPPTDEEKTSGDRRKEGIVTEEERKANESAENGKKTATVVITDAGQYDNIIEVRSFISDHYQDGTCTITFRKDVHVVIKDTPAYRDVSTTICTNPLIKRSEFPVSGTWQVDVSYDSANGSGKSKTQNIDIK